MKCPHCLEAFHEDWETEQNVSTDEEYSFGVRTCICPSCTRSVIQLGQKKRGMNDNSISWGFVYPKAISRSPIPTEVDDEILISDYSEACNVLESSAKASSALSRRCLQHILREKANVEHSDLYTEIDTVIDSGKLPSDLAKNLDCVRLIGNFATHPTKSKNSGEIIDVESGEAEWNLDVVEELMDFYFVRPARAQKKKEALNIKLKEAGKHELPL